MNLRNLFLLDTVVAFLFALATLLGPSTVLKFFGLSTGNSEQLLAQIIGAALVGFGLLGWFAKDFTDTRARDGAVLSLFLFSAIGFVVTLLAELSNVTRAGSAWIIVVVFLFFTLGYGYFQFIGPSE